MVKVSLAQTMPRGHKDCLLSANTVLSKEAYAESHAREDREVGLFELLLKRFQTFYDAN